MRSSLWDRTAASGGILFVILFVVGAIVMGSAPDVDENANSVVSFFTDNRGEILAGTFIQGLGVVAMLGFVGNLVTHMRETRHAALAETALGGFVLAFAIGSIAAITRAALAYGLAADMEPGTVRGIYHATLVMDVMSALIVAAFIGAVGLAMMHHEFLPAWFGWLSGIVAAYCIVASTAWAESGFWSPTGGLQIITYIVFLAWTVVASALCLYELTAAHPAREGEQPIPV